MKIKLIALNADVAVDIAASLKNNLNANHCEKTDLYTNITLMLHRKNLQNWCVIL